MCVSMQGWAEERVVTRDVKAATKLVLVRPNDPASHLRKVKEVTDTLVRHMSLAPNFLLSEKLTVRTIPE